MKHSRSMRDSARDESRESEGVASRPSPRQPAEPPQVHSGTPGAGDVLIRRSRPDDVHGIAELLAKCFPGRRTVSQWKEEWNWKFSRSSRAIGCSTVAVDGSGNIVGHYGSVLRRYKVGTRPLQGAVPYDNVVDPGFRGAGKVQRMLFADQKRWGPEMDVRFGIGFPNEEAYPVGKRLLGYQDLTRMKVLRAELSPFHRAIRRARRIKFPLDVEPDFQLREMNGFGDEFQELWHEVGPTLDCTEERDIDYLRWRYEDAPGRPYTILGIEQAGKLRGCAVCTIPEPGTDDGCHLVDFFCRLEPREVRALALSVLKWAGPRAPWIETWVTNTRAFCGSLLEVGFRWDGREIPVVYWIFCEKLNTRRFESPDMWYFTAGNTDSF